MISVIIPLFNKEREIVRSLQSVLNQSFSHFEIVVIDDGSTDHSVKRVEQIDDPRIKIIRQTNAGVAAARNRGVAEARYDWVALLDADDEWREDFLTQMFDLIQRYPQCAVHACGYDFCDDRGKITPARFRRIKFTEEHGIMENYFEIACHSHPPLCSSAVVIRKTALMAIGGFPTDIQAGEDLLTWARLAAHYPIAYTKQHLAIYHATNNFAEPPKRQPARKDRVAEELYKLSANKQIPQLRNYLSHWHKMRCSIYLRMGERRKVLREALKALYYNPFNGKIYLYAGMTLSPMRLMYITAKYISQCSHRS